jgi:hypothetical protein
MDTVGIDPAQIQQLLDSNAALQLAIQTALKDVASVVVSGLACVCFWLGMNSWESVAK